MISVYHSASFTVKATRVIDDQLYPCTLDVSFEIDDEDADDTEFEIFISKAKLWFEQIVNHSVMFGITEDDSVRMLFGEDGEFRVSNRLFACPSTPSDQLLSVLFLAKLRAMATDGLDIHTVSIHSDNAYNLTMTAAGDTEGNLPTARELFGPDVLLYFEEMWWDRADASIFDAPVPKGAKKEDRPAWALKFDMSAYDETEEEKEPPVEDKSKPKAKRKPKASTADPKNSTVAFTPTVISGGKDNDKTK